MEKDSFENWLRNWFNFKDDINIPKDLPEKIKILSDDILSIVARFHYPIVRSNKKIVFLALKTGQFEPTVIEWIETLLKSSRRTEEFTESVWNFVAEVRKHPKFIKAQKVGFRQIDTHKLIEKKKALEIERDRSSETRRDVEYVNSPLTEKIKEIRNRFKDSNRVTAEEVLAVGEVVFEDFKLLEKELEGLEDLTAKIREIDRKSSQLKNCRTRELKI